MKDVRKAVMIDRHHLKTAAVVLVLLAVVSGVCVAFSAAPFESAQGDGGQLAQKSFTVTGSTKGGITEVSVNAENARLSEIAADLSRALNAPVFVGPTLMNETITAKFSDAPLEPALRSLAPRVLIDYEIRQNAPLVPLGIYLVGFADRDPDLTAVVRGRSQGLLIAGNTEDTGQPSKDDPLQIIYEKSRLTLRSKQQPLQAVVLAIADTLGVAAEIKYETVEIVNTEIKDSSPEDVLLALSPSVRLYVRVDANLLNRTLLRIVVARPEAR
jgi:type II secretory pathway component GspD/PulD (secretin)